MIIELSARRKKPVPALLCAVGLADEAEADGKVVAEFYPVDLLLALREGDQRLEGHPFLDLQPPEGDPRPTVMVERLTRTQAARIRREIDRGRMVAVGLVSGRPARASRSSRWRRTQFKQAVNSLDKPGGGRSESARLYYVDSAETPLTAEDAHWIAAVCESGRLYIEALRQAQAVEALGRFVQGLGRAALQAQPKEAKKRGKKQRRQRRREEVWA